MILGRLCGGKGRVLLPNVLWYQSALLQEINLPESDKFEVEIIDTWEMTITPLPGEYSGNAVLSCLQSSILH